MQVNEYKIGENGMKGLGEPCSQRYVRETKTIQLKLCIKKVKLAFVCSKHSECGEVCRKRQ